MKNWLMNYSWRKFQGNLIIAIGTVVIVGSFILIGVLPVIKAKCNIPDTYGTHHDGEPPVTCTDSRQKLIIERTGQLIGWYEYRCHCD